MKNKCNLRAALPALLVAIVLLVAIISIPATAQTAKPVTTLTRNSVTTETTFSLVPAGIKVNNTGDIKCRFYNSSTTQTFTITQQSQQSFCVDVSHAVATETAVYFRPAAIDCWNDTDNLTTFTASPTTTNYLIDAFCMR